MSNWLVSQNNFPWNSVPMYYESIVRKMIYLLETFIFGSTITQLCQLWKSVCSFYVELFSQRRYIINTGYLYSYTWHKIIYLFLKWSILPFFLAFYWTFSYYDEFYLASDIMLEISQTINVIGNVIQNTVPNVLLYETLRIWT